MQGYKMQGDPTLIWMHKPSKYLALETSELRKLSYYKGPEKKHKWLKRVFLVFKKL